MDGSGGGGGGGPSVARRVLGAAGCAVPRFAQRARRPTGRPSPRPARTSRRSRRRRSAPGRGRGPRPRPAAGRERGAAHDPRRPDVAVDAALVAEPVDAGAPRRGARRTRPCSSGTCERTPAMLRLDVGLLERRPSTAVRIARSSASGSSSAERLGDVEAVEEPVADEVEVAGHRRAHVAVERAQRLEDARRDRRRRRAARCAAGSWRSPRSAAASSADAPADTGEAPRMRPSSSAGAARPVADVGEEVAGRRRPRSPCSACAA